jgi:hypothetical protein
MFRRLGLLGGASQVGGDDVRRVSARLSSELCGLMPTVATPSDDPPAVAGRIFMHRRPGADIRTRRRQGADLDRRLPFSSVAFPRKRFVRPFTSSFCAAPSHAQAKPRPDRYGPARHTCNVSAVTTPCAPFHKPLPRKRGHAADRVKSAATGARRQPFPCVQPTGPKLGQPRTQADGEVVTESNLRLRAAARGTTRMRHQ